MRRLLSSLLGLLILSTAALVPGAAVFVRPASAFSCAAEPRPLAMRIQEADVIVVGTVQGSGGSLAIAPDAFLKGPARPEALALVRPASEPECPLAAVSAGQRVLAFLRSDDTGFAFPDTTSAYVLAAGQARLTGDVADEHSESGLVSAIRSVTNLYAVPARSTGEGASIDWAGTVLPVGVALLVVFGIGLLLMRTWHRIDPT